MALWRELRGLGYPGTPKGGHRWLSPRRSRPSKHGPKREHNCEAAQAANGGSAPALPLPRQIAWSLTRPPERRTPEEEDTVERIRQGAAAATVSTLVRRFAYLVRGRSLSATLPCRAPLTALKGWLRDARRSGVHGVIAFAKRTAAGRRHSEIRTHDAVEQRADRGTGQQTEAAEMPDLRSGQLRPRPPSRAPRRLIHAKRGRATQAGEVHPSPRSPRGRDGRRRRAGLGRRARSRHG
jgi:hypothetical protein